MQPIAKFFANVGKTDYFNLRQGRVPLEEFLRDYLQPSGWLLSLAHKQQAIPTGRKIIDCGANFYRQQQVPHLRGQRVDSHWAWRQAQSLLNEDDIFVAPDHILHEDFANFDLDFRRQFNRDNALEVIETRKMRESGVNLMAVAHGLSATERIDQAQWLYKLGYRFIGVGGLVPEASNLKFCVGLVKEIKRTLPSDASIHVFGLNSPRYGKEWTDAGIYSFDGRTYVTRSIQKNAWLDADGQNLIEYPVVEAGQEPAAPYCICPVCDRLRSEGFDTRVRGTRQATLGRIAHNLGAQIAATRNRHSMRQLTLVACVSGKLDHAAPAEELYQGQWWKAAKGFAQMRPGSWYALSARHGIVSPSQMLAPYDETLIGKPKTERIQWSEKVIEQLGAIAAPGAEITFVTGRKYREFVIPKLLTNPNEVWTARVPAAGLNIGQQIQFFKLFTPVYKQLSLIPF